MERLRGEQFHRLIMSTSFRRPNYLRIARDVDCVAQERGQVHPRSGPPPPPPHEPFPAPSPAQIPRALTTTVNAARAWNNASAVGAVGALVGSAKLRQDHVVNLLTCSHYNNHQLSGAHGRVRHRSRQVLPAFPARGWIRRVGTSLIPGFCWTRRGRCDALRSPSIRPGRGVGCVGRQTSCPAILLVKQLQDLGFT